MLSELSDKKVAIWGMGMEGKAVLTKLNEIYPTKNIIILDDVNAKTELEKNIEIVILSPGVSIYKNEIIDAIKRGTIFITEKTFFYNELKNSKVITIGITGTKGKTTTATFCSYILSKLGYKTLLTGNIGIPTINLIDEAKKSDFVVTELSSYQCSTLQAFPKVGIVLNLYPEHIDWHKTHENYYRDKMHLLDGVEIAVSEYEKDKIEYVDLTNNYSYTKRKSPQVQNEPIGEFNNSIIKQNFNNVNIIKKEYNSTNFPIIYKDGFWWQNDKQLWNTKNMKLLGEHNYKNLSFVFSALYKLGIDLTKIKQEWLNDFNPIEHRLEIIDKNNIKFVNDSICTIPQAAIACFETFRDYDIYAILGGYDREQDYSEIVKYIKEHKNIKFIAMLGQTASRVASEFDKIGFNNYKICGKLIEGHKKLSESGLSGDVGVDALRECIDILKEKIKNDKAKTMDVNAKMLNDSNPLDSKIKNNSNDNKILHNKVAILLSPAAPSYDMFKNFEERGRVFKESI